MQSQDTATGSQAHERSTRPLTVTGEYILSAPASGISGLAASSEKYLKLAESHGAVIFRDSGLKNAAEFHEFIQNFPLKNFSYDRSLSNAVRVNCTDRVFTANEAPPDTTIYLHHEMAQTPFFPGYLFFFCEAAPEKGGQTPLCRSDYLFLILQERLPEFIQKCESTGFIYSNCMPAENNATSGQGRSWQSTLGVSDKESAEKTLHRLNYSWQWLNDDQLQVSTCPLPAVRTLSDGRKVFFNQLIAAYCGWNESNSLKPVCFGDHSRIPPKAMDTVLRTALELTYEITWKKGDVALVDNLLILHGRKPYHGKRRILASLTADDGLRFRIN